MEDGEKISFDVPMIANSREDAPEKRTFHEKFILKSREYKYGDTKINAQQKKVIISALQEEFSLCDLESVLENLAMYIDDKLYMPLSCKLIDKLGDSRATTVIYETLFKCCSNMLNGYWNQSNSYSNYLVLLNVGFFNAIAYKLHLRDSYSVSMENLYDQTGYDEFVESLYEKHLDDIGWDADVELDVIDELINDSKITSTFDNGTQEEYMHAVESMKNICREHVVTIHKENEAEGFTRIVQKTGIRELKSMDIQGFECHFCEAKFSDEKYIIVYQKKTHIMNHSEVTQIKWVKSLDTTGFRDFCFDKKNMTFGQINLFYGANGSGKTSVLEAIEYAIHQSGKWYTDDNIDQMLMERHLNKKARRSSNKNHFKGTKKRTEEDDVRFAQSFEKLLLMAQERRESE